MKNYYVCWLLLVGTVAHAQTNIITLQKCYELAKQNYPLIKKHNLISRSSSYSIENAAKLYLPKFSLFGQATYQSETIDFQKAIGGGPGTIFPVISKDQYIMQAEVNQTIYDGGLVKNQQEIIRANEAIQQQTVEVNLYALNNRINQLYFAILLLDEQLVQNNINRENFQNSADKAKAAYENGTSLKSNVDEFLAQIATTEMVGIEMASNRKAYADMLAVFIGQRLDENSKLAMPPPVIADPVIKRPEIILFDLNKKIYDVQDKQLTSEYTPRVSAFARGAYGRPTLNYIDNNFGAWWIGGVRLLWNLGSLYTVKNNRNNLKINKQFVDVDKELFIYNTNLSLKKESEDAVKSAALVRKDETIVSLRTSVAQAAKAQLENGVITVHDYISKLNEENLARQSKILHSIQLIQAQYQYKNTTGN